MEHNFGVDFQKEVLKLMLQDMAFMLKCLNHLEDDFFQAGPLRWMFKTIKAQYTTYKTNATSTVLATEIAKNVNPTDQLQYVECIQAIIKLDRVNADYIKDNLALFIKKNMFVKSYMESGTLWNAKKIDDAFAMMSKTMTDINRVTFKHVDRSYFFDDYTTRQLQRMADNSDPVHRNAFPTGIMALDENVFTGAGGLSRGEIGLIVGDTKAGKSIALNHMAFATARTFSGNVLLITLEGSRRLTENRLDSRFSGELYNNVKFGNFSDNEIELQLRKEYENLRGSMVVRGFTEKWDYNVEDIEREVDELAANGFNTDLLVVDYLDLLYPRQYEAGVSLYERQTMVTQELKLLANRRDIALWTASQARRPQNKANDPMYVMRANEMADSYGKARTVDLVLTLNFTEKERSENKMRVFVERYRDNAAGIVIPIRTDFKRMCFFDNRMDIGVDPASIRESYNVADTAKKQSFGRTVIP